MIQNVLTDDLYNDLAFRNGSRKLELPSPEFYVIFTGERQDKPEYLNLSEEFFGGEKGYLEVKVKMLTEMETETSSASMWLLRKNTRSRQGCWEERWRQCGKRSVSARIRMC